MREKEKGDLPIGRTHALYIDIIFQWFKNNSMAGNKFPVLVYALRCGFKARDTF